MDQNPQDPNSSNQDLANPMASANPATSTPVNTGMPGAPTATPVGEPAAPMGGQTPVPAVSTDIPGAKATCPECQNATEDCVCPPISGEATAPTATAAEPTMPSE